MKKWLLLIFTFKISLSFAQQEKDFDLLMGRETPAWQYVQTAEDNRRLEFFRTLFQKQILDLAKIAVSKNTIPKIIHFIWLGPENFPQKSIDRLTKWIELHPDWTFKFWTDMDRKIPHPAMKKCFVSDFSFQKLGNEYYHSVNFGEKAKVLAYEILLAEGGISVDHDTAVYQSFDDLNNQFDFYCGLQELAPSILSSSVIPSTHLIGAKPNHPILKETVSWLEEHWDLLEQCYPGEFMHESQLRMQHRTFWAFSEGIDLGINQNGNEDIIFPVAHFSGKQRKAASYAVHLCDGKLCSTQNHFERKVNEKFEEMIQKDDEAVILTLVLAFVSFLACIFLLFYIRAIKRRNA